MVLVDSSIWIDHLRSGHPVLQELLHDTKVLTHPMVIGELACGQIGNRREVFRHLDRLPLVQRAIDFEVLAMIEDHRLYGMGIGWIDAHLLASARLDACRLLTRDKSLLGAAEQVGVEFVS